MPEIKQVALIQCVELGQRDIVKELIDQGADVNEKNADADTALLVAARRNDLQLIEMLITHGSEIEVSDLLGYSPLMWAKEHGNLRAVELIEKAIKNRD